jgi:multidrug resistance protein MdtO
MSVLTRGVRRVLGELRPMPDRLAGTLRITAAVLPVLVVMLTFRNKVIAIGCVLVFLLMQRNTAVTTLVGILLVPALLLASLTLTGITMVAWDVAWLRLLLMTLVFLGGFWLMSRLPVLSVIAMLPLVLLSTMIFDFDKYPYPNQLLSQIGWIWAAVGLAMTATVLVQRIGKAPTGREVLRDDLRRLLGDAEENCLGRAFGRHPRELGGRIRATMARDEAAIIESAKKLGKVKLLAPSQLENCILLARAASCASGIARGTGGPSDAAEWRDLATRFRRLRRTFLLGSVSPGAGRDLPSPLSALNRAERALGILPPDHEQEPQEEEPEGPPQFGNLEFASRATMATMACYLFASLTDWSGIHTCMITCVVTALSRLDAQTSKQFQRLLGATIGGGMAMVAMVWLIPATNEFTGVLLILAAGTAVAAWCSYGREKVSYVGFQMGLAFYLTLLQDPHATTKLDPLRDRLVGIYVGILAMRFFFTIPLSWQARSPCREEGNNLIGQSR